MVNLVGSEERLVQTAHEVRDAIGRIQTLIRIHLRGVVGIGGDLPAADVNRFQAGGNLLHGLVPRHRAEGGGIGFGMKQTPEALGSEARKRVFDVHRAAQVLHILLTIGALDSRPAWICLPLRVQIQRSAVAWHLGSPCQP